MTSGSPSPSRASGRVPDQVELSRPTAHCCVLAPVGEVDAYTAPALRSRVIDVLASNGVTSLVVDLTRTTFLDSSALGVLVGGLKRAREQGRTLVLVVPSGGVRRIFEITSLDRVFELHETLESAVSSS